MVVSVLGGLAASVIFKRVWKLVHGEDETPTATQRHRTWSEVLVAALLQGAIFGLVKGSRRPGRGRRVRTGHRGVAR